MEDALAGGRQAILSLPGAMPVEGGLPLMNGSDMIGAIGVSGVTSQQDGQIAAAGAAAAAAMK
jgi:glc operon protein GlcG